MERKTLLGLSFFLFVLLAAQEAVVKIEGCEKKSSVGFGGLCIGPKLSYECNFICMYTDHLKGGYCKNEECMCSC
ncbi:hypothetical protein MtrunA17_Chr8g0337721 [Medicago truncatula]|uniref:Defensin-like protein n=1 Tax=Medicago truncatula TaxID=3880 RepID=A0A072TLF1_MEDTR|nr:Defensin-like protein [Medicago truncatula]RHN38863.1 hypothetical protein MtrunA17_Chr8g0337721 [Medicago truncatula]